jgi:hypothetical protein
MVRGGSNTSFPRARADGHELPVAPLPLQLEFLGSNLDWIVMVLIVMCMIMQALIGERWEGRERGERVQEVIMK